MLPESQRTATVESRMHPFEEALLDHWPIAGQPEERVVIAVSGGADSMALAGGIIRIRSAQGCLVAHFNHRLRGAEADDDAQFVAEQCAAWGVGATTGHWDRSVDFQTPGQGPEAAAREVRYAFLKNAAHAAGARYVVTAHTADDQVETVMQRILRGTGIAGLAGIPRQRPLSGAVSVVRPLLRLSREQTRTYLRDSAIPFREDSSNLNLRFTRNRIRHELLPNLRARFSSTVDEALLRIAAQAADSQAIVQQVVDRLASKAIVASKGTSVVLARKELAAESVPVVRELLIQIWRQQAWPRQQMNAQRWHELASEAVTSYQADRVQMLPGSIRVAFLRSQIELTADTKFNS